MNSFRLLGVGLRSRPLVRMSRPLVAYRSLVIPQAKHSSYSSKILPAIILNQSVQNLRTYSTAPPPPPPPPPPPKDKNSKGKVLLNRISRAFTFSLSTVLVIGATGVALLVVYLILSELFLPSGDTKTFNKAVKLVEKNEQVRNALKLEKGERLRAYGETVSGKWVRNRPVQSIRMKDNDGKDRLVMKFHVESDAGKHGTVSLEQIDQSFFSSEFAYIALDMPRSKRLYIIEPKFKAKDSLPIFNKDSSFLGVKWGPKKD